MEKAGGYGGVRGGEAREEVQAEAAAVLEGVVGRGGVGEELGVLPTPRPLSRFQITAETGVSGVVTPESPAQPESPVFAHRSLRPT